MALFNLNSIDDLPLLRYDLRAYFVALHLGLFGNNLVSISYNEVMIVPKLDHW